MIVESSAINYLHSNQLRNNQFFSSNIWTGLFLTVWEGGGGVEPLYKGLFVASSREAEGRIERAIQSPRIGSNLAYWNRTVSYSTVSTVGSKV